MFASMKKSLVYMSILGIISDNCVLIGSALRCHQCITLENCEKANLGKNGTGHKLLSQVGTITGGSAAITVKTDVTGAYGERECEPAQSDEVQYCESASHGGVTFYRSCGVIDKTYFREDCPIRPPAVDMGDMQECMCFTDHCNGDPNYCCHLKTYKFD